MADEYIRRDDAITAACKGFCHPGVRCPETPCREQTKYLRDLPSADVVQVVHAHWIPQKENHEFKEVWMKCSACGYPVSRWTGNTNFCPNCGADMRGEQE